MGSADESKRFNSRSDDKVTTYVESIGKIPDDFDDTILSYTNGVLTGVVYKLGIVTLVTLTLSYTNGLLTRVQYT